MCACEERDESHSERIIDNDGKGNRLSLGNDAKFLYFITSQTPAMLDSVDRGSYRGREIIGMVI